MSVEDFLRNQRGEWSSLDSTDPEDAHREAMERGARCKECPLFGLQEGPVASELTPGASLAICGEAPSVRDVEDGKPFVGPPGRELRRALRGAGLKRGSEGLKGAHILNAMGCRPPGGKPYPVYLQRLKREKWKGLEPHAACAPRLRRDLADAVATLDPEAESLAVVPLGRFAHEAVAANYGVSLTQKGNRQPGFRGMTSLKGQRGHPFKVEGSPVVILPSYSPSQSLRSAMWQLGAMQSDIMRARRISLEGYRFKPADRIIAWSPPLPPGSPWKAELPEWWRPIQDPKEFIQVAGEALRDGLKDLASWKGVMTVDIETAGVEADAPIRIVNLGWYDKPGGEETALVLPLRWIDGTPVNPVRGFHKTVKTILAKVLDRAPQLGLQNGTFDTMHLLREGFMEDRAQYWHDTMLGHRASEWCENKHNLGAIMADLGDRLGGAMELHKDKFLHGGEDKQGG